ncbi:MAG TPA: beta-L-arabinofuranosidase domain-containing protein [Puia sp.]|nr:beta-L-arabinofuranosidase domain-containing protein [Puia sp.]
MPRQWKFKMGDSLHWANPSYSDNDWELKALGNSWSTKDVKDNVFAWYRTKIIIPSSIKSTDGKGQGIKLHLGKIDDVDQTFFNGKQIGQTGSLPPTYESKWDAVRTYFIPEKEILWDRENVIAVRVFSLDNGGVGMYEGPYNVGPVEWTDYISVHHNNSAITNAGFTTTLGFSNTATATFIGSVRYWITDKNDRELFTQTKSLQIEPAKDGENLVTFTNYHPGAEDILKVSYLVSQDSSLATIRNQYVYLVNKQIEIKGSVPPKPVVENKVPDVFTPIAFKDQQLRGYLGTRLRQNLEERLLKVDENGIMGGYLERPGNHPWIGEHVGKYLESACNVWKNTNDPRLKKQMDRMMYELINTQLPDGYLGTYTQDKYWTSWDVWSHKYNLYGLLAYYAATGYQPALEACKRIGDLLSKTFGNKPGQLDIILAGEHVGMAATSVLDPMVELYRYTGEKKYLDFCYYIIDAWEQSNGPKIMSTLLSSGKVNKVANGKAYEMLSNLVGLIKLYRVTGDQKFLTPVLIAWNDIVSRRLYITGTTSSLEYFQADEILPAGAGDNMGEGCVTVTWIQLNQNLLALTGDLKYVDQIEKSIYNHLLGAENPETGCVSYYTPLVDKKPYSCDITCCTSSVPRGIATVPYFTFGNVRTTPTLMLYEPALYKENITVSGDKNIRLSLEVESSFPESGDALIIVNTSETAYFPISLRVPLWCHSFVAKLGDKQYKGIPDQYITIPREWRNGEKIRVSFDLPMQIIKGGRSYPGQIAFQRGPQILAFDSSLNGDLGKNAVLTSAQFLIGQKLECKTDPNALPAQWIGKQAYSIHVVDSGTTQAKHQFIVVPFADAGQTGGTVKVWMQLKMADK